MNFIASLLCTLIDSIWIESQRFAKSKTIANFFKFALTVSLVAVLVTALFGFISKLGGLK